MPLRAHYELHAQDRQLLGPVGAQDEDAFDVAGAAGAGDERDHAGETAGVAGLDQADRLGQVAHELIAPGQDDVVRGQDGEIGYGGSCFPKDTRARF